MWTWRRGLAPELTGAVTPHYEGPMLAAGARGSLVFVSRTDLDDEGHPDAPEPWGVVVDGPRVQPLAAPELQALTTVGDDIIGVGGWPPRLHHFHPERRRFRAGRTIEGVEGQPFRLLSDPHHERLLLATSASFSGRSGLHVYDVKSDPRLLTRAPACPRAGRRPFLALNPANQALVWECAGTWATWPLPPRSAP